MDAIYLLLITPLALVLSFITWKFKQYKRDLNRLPEAKPYQFERDQFIPEFNDYTQMLIQRKTNKN